jgi:hypothetical protein
VNLALDQLLAQIAAMLRADIGPSVSEPFAKTQAFMAAVILEKVAAELRATEAASATSVDDVKRVAMAIETEAGAAGHVRAALDRLGTDPSDAGWSALVRALYAERSTLGEERFARLLSEVRRTLRTRLDRVLVYAA